MLKNYVDLTPLCFSQCWGGYEIYGMYLLVASCKLLFLPKAFEQL